MKMFLEMVNFKKCRLWLNNFETLIKEKEGKVLSGTIPSTAIKKLDNIQIAIEVSLPKNMSNYALIGFEFIPSEQIKGNTSITIKMNNVLREYPDSTLAKPNDKVFVGISEEYGQSVLDSAIETLNEIGGFPSGEIVFNIGAYSECGSSKSIFGKATKVLLKISQLDLIKMTDSSIQKEIESML